jgi:hypothetical protein
MIFSPFLLFEKNWESFAENAMISISGDIAVPKPKASAKAPASIKLDEMIAM